jgi:hypothetical protein
MEVHVYQAFRTLELPANRTNAAQFVRIPARVPAYGCRVRVESGVRSRLVFGVRTLFICIIFNVVCPAECIGVSLLHPARDAN